MSPSSEMLEGSSRWPGTRPAAPVSSPSMGGAGGDQAAVDFWKAWMAEELPFLQDQRPWARADFIVCGTSVMVHGPATQLVVAPALPP